MDGAEQRIKAAIMSDWAPSRNVLGLKGLIEVAAKAAVEVASRVTTTCEELEQLTHMVEDLTEKLRLTELLLYEYAGGEELDRGEDLDQETSPTELMSQYDCTQCFHSHRVDSSIGKEHLPQYLREQVEANVEQVSTGDSAGK